MEAEEVVMMMVGGGPGHNRAGYGGEGAAAGGGGWGMEADVWIIKPQWRWCWRRWEVFTGLRLVA